jgi:hypothetical protein
MNGFQHEWLYLAVQASQFQFKFLPLKFLPHTEIKSDLCCAPTHELTLQQMKLDILVLRFINYVQSIPLPLCIVVKWNSQESCERA